jgi:TPR repeat protein
MRKLSVSIVILALVLVTSSALADNMDDALDAANFGDYEKARNLWLIEAEKGSAVAQANIGLLYEDGLGVPQSDKEAVKWYRMAAEQGEPRAQYYLGTAFEEGRGVPQDYQEAAKNYHLAATRGYVKAQYKLGLLYLKGQGVIQSTETAYAWWSVAASKGHEDAQKYKDSAQQQMTPKQIETAQGIAKQIWAELGN